MDSLEQISAAGTPELRPEPAGLGPAGGTLSAAEQARAERRAARLALLGRVGKATAEAIERVNDYMNGRLSEEACRPFERIADPGLTLSRLNLSLQRTVALEERLDESDEEREERRRQEAEARAREEAKRRADDARETRAPADPKLVRKRKVVRHAMRNILRDFNLDLDRQDRERLLDDLFSDYEDYDDYSGDPERIVLDMCYEEGVNLTPDAKGKSAVYLEARALAVVRRYLAKIAPDLCADLEDEPYELAQGPPDR
jgi:hypothetical protein